MSTTLTKPIKYSQPQTRTNAVTPFRHGVKADNGNGNNNIPIPPNGSGGGDDNHNECSNSFDRDMRIFTALNFSISNDLKKYRVSTNINPSDLNFTKGDIQNLIQRLETLMFNCEDDPDFKKHKDEVKIKIKGLKDQLEELNNKFYFTSGAFRKSGKVILKRQKLSISSVDSYKYSLPRTANWQNQVLEKSDRLATRIMAYLKRNCNKAYNYIESHGYDVVKISDRNAAYINEHKIEAWLVAAVGLAYFAAPFILVL